MVFAEARGMLEPLFFGSGLMLDALAQGIMPEPTFLVPPSSRTLGSPALENTGFCNASGLSCVPGAKPSFDTVLLKPENTVQNTDFLSQASRRVNLVA
jgi:hypothetical protein